MGRRDALLGLGAALGLGMASIVLPRPAFAGAAPGRVIVAGGALTETVFALGAGEAVVGVDSTSTWPEAVHDLPQIGYFRDLGPEGLLSLAPDLVLAEHGAGPQSTLDRLAGAGVRVAVGPEVLRADDIPEKIAFAGRELGREGAAARLSGEFRAALAEVAARVARLGARPRVLFVMTLQSGSPVVGGANTAADEMIRRAGGENVARVLEGYKPMSREAILAAAPEAVVMMAHQATALGGAGNVLARPEFAATPAARKGRAVAMPGSYLLGFGPRTPQAVADLARALHPEAAEALRP